MRTETQTLAYEPWPHQVASAQAHAKGVRWQYKLWHRKAGKDLSEFLYGVLPRAYREPGIYFHCFPEQQQGRKAFWDGRAVDGTRYLDMVPKGMLKSKPNETEMQLEFRTSDPKKTSIYQVVGADRLGWIGANPRGVIMSEYQRQDPLAWQLLTPILMANQGWASFCLTPWGHNHAWQLYESVKDRPEWHVDVKTVLETVKPDGTRIVSDADLEFERTVLLKKEAYIQSEYFCAFESDLEYAVFGELVQKARRDGRIRHDDPVPGVEVIPAFDIGHADATACGWWQCVNGEHRLLRYEEKTGTTVDYWAERLKAHRVAYGYTYRYVAGEIYAVAPHDAAHTHWAGHSAVETARRQGVYLHVVEKLSEPEQLQRARMFFPKIAIHQTDAARFVDICHAFRYAFDEVSQRCSDKTVHDWASHGAKMYCYYATAQSDAPAYTPATRALTAFDVYADAVADFDPYLQEVI